MGFVTSNGLRRAVMLPGVAALLANLTPVSAYQKLHRVDKPDHTRTRSRYMPHQGKQEMARRRAQMLKAYGKSPVVRFYGQLSGGEQ
jgi:hypothetical protein